MLFNNLGKATAQEEVSRATSNAIMEAIMIENLTQDELSMFLENQEEVDAALEEGVLLEKTIVRLDKHAKLSKAYKQAIFRIAKEENDAKFKKLMTLWKTERVLEDYLEKKYGAKAMRAAKQTVRNNQKSKSALVSKAVTRAKQTLNPGTTN